jgi:hypothetical protein
VRVAEFVVFATIAGGVITWSLAEVMRSRALWTMAALLTIVHSVAAFLVFYDGSHVVAQEQTTRQAAALTGVEFAGGIYINYLLLVVWAGDVVWSWLAPTSYASRPMWLHWSVHGFIFFIVFNGAVIFADGLARVVGIVSVTLAAFFASWRLIMPGCNKLQSEGGWHR